MVKGVDFRFGQEHIREQFCRRYRRFADRFDEIFGRVSKSLTDHTPPDWRFTESPSSRFFVLEEESGARFLGMSYRHGPRAQEMLMEIQSSLGGDFSSLLERLPKLVCSYVDLVCDPDLSIVHELRTVYGTGIRAHIAEDKRLWHQARSLLGHVVPLQARKIAARPNAAVLTDGSLWVRQYHNWVATQPNSKEYYLFQPLGRDGTDRSRSRIYSFTENGRFKLVQKQNTTLPPNAFRPESDWKNRADNGIRTESYWKLPTLLDQRLIDLDYRERYIGRATTMTAAELLELYCLRRIVDGTKRELYGTG